VAGQPRMVAGRPAHVAKAPPFYPKGVVVELKREIVEGKEERREKAASPCGQSPSIQSLLSNSTSSCSSHAYSTCQKHQKQSQFLSSFSKVPFIYLFEIFRFYLLYYAFMK
jgi:hypothetical protein